MSIPQKGILSRLFRKHKYAWFIAPRKSVFMALNGERHIEVCTKCGKKRGERYARID